MQIVQLPVNQIKTLCNLFSVHFITISYSNDLLLSHSVYSLLNQLQQRSSGFRIIHKKGRQSVGRQLKLDSYEQILKLCRFISNMNELFERQTSTLIMVDVCISVSFFIHLCPPTMLQTSNGKYVCFCSWPT